MKKIICLTFAVFLPISIYAQELKLATFNCEFLNKKKIHVKYGFSFHLNDSDEAIWTDTHREQKLLEATDSVSKVIAQVNADIIVLTEVGDSSDVALLLDEVANEGINYPHFAVGTSTDLTTGQHVAIFSKIPFDSVSATIPGREHYWEEPDDPDSENDTGISKGMSVALTFDGRPIRIYGVHFASELGGHEKDQQRIAQGSIVRRNYLPHLKNGEIIIVAGDLNDKRGQPTLTRVRGLDDIEKDLLQTGLVEYFESDKLNTRWTFEYQGIFQQIDHILISRNVESFLKRFGGINSSTLDHNIDLASDHNAFIVVLNFN